MVALFAVLCGLAAIWSIYKYHTIHDRLVDSLPPQFQDYAASRQAIPVYVLEPSTPPALQAEYAKATAGGCLAMICLALSGFFASQPIVASFGAVGFLLSAISMVKATKAYRENCRRYSAGGDRMAP